MFASNSQLWSLTMLFGSLLSLLFNSIYLLVHHFLKKRILAAMEERQALR